MNKEEIERIALGVAKEMPDLLWEEGCIQESGILKQEATEFAARFLARIDAERGRDAVAWRTETGYSQPEYLYHSLPPIRSKGDPLFLSPATTIPEKLSLYLEPALISAEHAKWEAATILADDDPSYDTFCGGWKAALKLLAAKGERKC